MQALPARPADAPETVEPVTHAPTGRRCRDLPLVPLSVTLSNVPAAATESVSMRFAETVVAETAVVPKLTEQAALDWVVTSRWMLVTRIAAASGLTQERMPPPVSTAASGTLTGFRPPPRGSS